MQLGNASKNLNTLRDPTIAVSERQKTFEVFAA